MLDGIGAVFKTVYRPCGGLMVQVAVLLSPSTVGDRTFQPVRERFDRDGFKKIELDPGEFLVLQYKDNEVYDSVWISHGNYQAVSNMFNVAVDYFDEEVYPGLFVKGEGGWSLNTLDYPKAGARINKLGSKGKSVAVFPDVSDGAKGVSLYLNDPTQSVFMTEREFRGMARVIDKMDMAGLATSLLVAALAVGSDRKTANPNLKRIN